MSPVMTTRIAFKALARNKMRTALTMLGMIIGVSAVITLVALGNGAQVGGGTELTPEADTEDGKIDVMISRAVGPWAKVAFVNRLRRGDHHERDDVRYLRGTTVTVSGAEFWCSADGEISGPERRRTWRLEPSAYSLVLPRENGQAS